VTWAVGYDVLMLWRSFFRRSQQPRCELAWWRQFFRPNLVHARWRVASCEATAWKECVQVLREERVVCARRRGVQ
jgi:hypothetical protein